MWRLPSSRTNAVAFSISATPTYENITAFIEDITYRVNIGYGPIAQLILELAPANLLLALVSSLSATRKLIVRINVNYSSKSQESQR